MRVGIVNVAPDHNKGACAIAWGLIERMRATGLPTQISAFSTSREPISPENYRHLMRAFPDVTLLPSPVFHRSDGLGLTGAAARRLADRSLYPPYIIGATLRLGLPGVFRRAGADKAFDELARCDVVLNRGGPFLTALGPPPNPTLLSYLWPFFFARKTGMPYGLIGESVGPLENRWAQELVRKVTNGAGLLAVREEFSRQVIRQTGVPDGHITTMPDNAFWVKPRRSGRVERLLRNRRLEHCNFLVVTPRAWPHGANKYLRELAKTIDELIPSVFEHALLVPHLFFPREPGRGDRKMSQDLLRLTQRQGLVSTVDEDLGPDELASLYGAASLVIGTRLHSLILAQLAGTPILPISYFGWKTEGVMKMLGIPGPVLRMRAFTHGEASRLAEEAAKNRGAQDRTAMIRDLRIRADQRLRGWLERVANAKQA